MPRRRTPEERYKYNVRKQQKSLEEFTAHEIEWAEDLIRWYGLRNQDMPDDEYRACAFFINKEYLKKPGSLTLLYSMYLRWCKELTKITKENAFDILCYRYRMYAALLKTGGYNGKSDWGRKCVSSHQ
jgi:hypothetical protein